MPKAIFKSLPSSLPELFPSNIFDKIPQNHPVRLVNSVVDSLDLSKILDLYPGGGASAYHPRMMIKVLFYSYLSNIYSSRKINKALHENIHFMFISGNSLPDHRTINDFRGKILKDSIKELFAEIVRLLVDLGYVSLDVQYIDGTKIEAKSNKYTFVWKGSIEKNKAKLEKKIEHILTDIETHIQSDNHEVNNDNLPEKFDSDELKKKVSEINKRLKSPTKQQLKEIKKLQDEYIPKLESYEKNLEVLGDRNSFSKTDTDATFMRMKDDHMNNGQLKPAYNAQISTENQFITHTSIHQTTTDTTVLIQHLDSFKDAHGKQSKEVTADAGYGSEENYEMLEKNNIEAYVKYNYFHLDQKKCRLQNPFLPHNLFYNKELDFYICPMGQKMTCVGKGTRISKTGYESSITYYQAQNCDGCTLRGMCHKGSSNRKIEVNHRLNQLKNKAKEYLNSAKGLINRSKRPIEVEAVFGQLKSNNKFNRFTLKGLKKVELEFILMAIGHNLRKMFAKGCQLA